MIAGGSFAAGAGFSAPFFALLGVVVIVIIAYFVTRAVRGRLNMLRAKLAALSTELEALEEGKARGSAVVVLLDEGEIKQECLRLREGAAEIRGSWCSKYRREEIEEYFNREHEDLLSNPNLIVRRTVNPTVVGEAWEKFYDLWTRSPAQDRWQIKLNPALSDAELLHVQYADNGRAPVGVLIINEVREAAIASDPALAFIFDPRREKWIRHGVNFIERWFEQIWNDPSSVPLTGENMLTWGGTVPSAYDRSVWRNPETPQFFKEYVRLEQALLVEHLEERAAETQKRVTLVEVGCGTGRALAGCAIPRLAGKVQYLIGFDFSQGMLSEAENKLREEIARTEDADRLEVLGRVRLTLLDALSLNLHFDNGALISPERSPSFPGSGLKWGPEGALGAYGVDTFEYFDSPKVFCCMLNTLGVLSDASRLTVLENVVRAAGAGDMIVLSLLDGDIFAHSAPLFYPTIRDVTRARSEDDEHYDNDDAMFHTSSNPRYSSRWMFEAPSPHAKTDPRNTARGLLRDLKERLEPELTLATELREVRPVDGSDRVGHFIVIRRQS